MSTYEKFTGWLKLKGLWKPVELTDPPPARVQFMTKALIVRNRWGVCALIRSEKLAEGKFNHLNFGARVLHDDNTVSEFPPGVYSPEELMVKSKPTAEP